MASRSARSSTQNPPPTTNTHTQWHDAARGQLAGCLTFASIFKDTLSLRLSWSCHAACFSYRCPSIAVYLSSNRPSFGTEAIHITSCNPSEDRHSTSWPRPVCLVCCVYIGSIVHLHGSYYACLRSLRVVALSGVKSSAQFWLTQLQAL